MMLNEWGKALVEGLSLSEEEVEDERTKYILELPIVTWW